MYKRQYMYGGGAESLLEDIYLINETLHKKYPELPLILFGHSRVPWPYGAL